MRVATLRRLSYYSSANRCCGYTAFVIENGGGCGGAVFQNAPQRGDTQTNGGGGVDGTATNYDDDAIYLATRRVNDVMC
jgi:hypothetical protein